MIVILHDLDDDALEAHKPELRQVFARAGVAFDETTVRFQRVKETDATGFSADVRHTEVFTSACCLTHTSPDNCDGFSLKETAWQRRNRNAPWYRQFQTKRRRS